MAKMQAEREAPCIVSCRATLALHARFSFFPVWVSLSGKVSALPPPGRDEIRKRLFSTTTTTTTTHYHSLPPLLPLATGAFFFPSSPAPVRLPAFAQPPAHHPIASHRIAPHRVLAPSLPPSLHPSLPPSLPRSSSPTPPNTHHHCHSFIFVPRAFVLGASCLDADADAGHLHLVHLFIHRVLPLHSTYTTPSHPPPPPRTTDSALAVADAAPSARGFPRQFYHPKGAFAGDLSRRSATCNLTSRLYIAMPPSFTTTPAMNRPRSGESARPVTRDDSNLEIPNRTSSLHSRIAQPIPSQMPQQQKTGTRAPKTLTHAYMVCGVGREPSQWVKAPAPTQGKIGHMKGAVGQFWLPEILGSSPRLEQDNDIARSLHSAMRVSTR
jgi:hypothetical protein